MADNIVDEFEPLFDYRRVQPRVNLVCLDGDDDEDDNSPKRRKNCTTAVEKKEVDKKAIPVVNCDQKEEDDWLLPPPKCSVKSDKLEDSTLKELRLKKLELLSFAQSAEDMLREVEETAKRECSNSVEFSLGSGEKQQIQAPCERSKVIIAFQDKEDLKRIAVFKDDKFERIFKLYAERYKIDLQRLSFSFDGDKVDPSATPASFDMEDEDIIEVRCL